MDAVTELPSDRQALIAIIRDQQAQIEQIKQEATDRLEQIKQEAADQLEAQRQKHQAELTAILRRFYGPKSERFDPTQLLLFGQRVDTMPLDEAAIAEEAGEPLATRRPGNKHKHGRGKLPDHLPRVRIEHDLPETE
jgi:hypothetical protein